MEGPVEPERLDLLQGSKQSQFQHRLAKLRQQPPVYKTTFEKGKIPMTLTFNDILLVPQYGEIESRSQCNVSSYFSKQIPLNIPIVSSPMDTVTESGMAIEMARNGGLGIIHRFMPIEEQCYEIEKVKRSGVFMNPNPVYIKQTSNYITVKELMKKYGISSFLVTAEQNVQSQPRLGSTNQKIIRGILTQRDINCFTAEDAKVGHIQKRFF